MKTAIWLCINKKGSVRARSARPALDWDEIAICLRIDVPDQLFDRPNIDARIEVKDVPNTAYNPDIILNTKDLIEQQTGAKINFTVVKEEGK